MSLRLSFELPAELEASEPPEARGIARDGVRLMVVRRDDGEVVHARFRELGTFLDPGDLLVVNSSATIPAAFDARTEDGTAIVVHLSTRLCDELWVVEPRRLTARGTSRWEGAAPRSPLDAGSGARVELLEPYLGGRLFIAGVQLPAPNLAWLDDNARPIRYDYVPASWPLSSYQTVFATEPGSAEMPSAGRPFTADVVADLVARGVGITPVVLHTGVASLEDGESPYPEWRSVPPWTAARVNATRADGGRVVTVGTTVARALESSVDTDGIVVPTEGWTDHVIGPDRPVRVVGGIVTGWHEPGTSHLQLLEAVAGRDALARSYAESLEQGYRFHEFGDSHLLLGASH